MPAEPPATIIREIPQPNTGGVGAVGLKVEVAGKHGGNLSYRPQYIIFSGKLKGDYVEIEVLAGEGSPTPSGGYAKWAHVQRPQRKALTVLEGYEPFTLTVPILFDAVRTNGVQEDIENKIQWLEWMAGRGNKQTKGFRDGTGKPPLIEIYASRGSERDSPLIAPYFQGGLKWFIDDIQWGEQYPQVMRSPGGARVRQAATVKLVEHVVDALASEPEQKTTGAKPFKTTHGLDTVKKLVSHYLVGRRSRLGEAVQATMKLNAHNKRVGSNPEKKLPAGTVIRIPEIYLEP